MERSKMTETPAYDSAEYLKDPETMRLYMDEAFATGDPALITHALGAIARASSMADIARKTGLSRESLYRALSADGRPELATIMKVPGALDLTLRTTAKKRRVTRNAQRATKKKTTRRKEVPAGRRIHA
jgi:probable addiction module antidote protein